jgi:transcriptional regulator with XRE-family HTH domain
MSRETPVLPTPVRRTLRQLGSDIRDARRRRQLQMAVVAERALISRPTLMRVERGDASVSVGIYATVLFVLGLLERLADVAAAAADDVGLALEEGRLPQRVRTPRQPPPLQSSRQND